MSSEILEAVVSSPEQAQPIAATGPRRVNFEEYLALGEDTDRIEWIDGEVVRMAPAAKRHQAMMLFLLHTAGLYVETHRLGWLVSAPFAMKLEAQRRGREPDILFVTQERSELVKETYLDGPADLAVEVISPESVGRDRGEKFIEYEAAGIPEYWLIDPERQRAEFYELGADRLYHLAAMPDGIYHSKVLPGFFLRVEWLWTMPPPTIAALRELKLIS
jgi:Uma2 family endonuclease